MAATIGLLSDGRMAAVVYQAGPGWAAIVADPARPDWFHELGTDFCDEAQARAAAWQYATERGHEIAVFPAVLEALEAIRGA